VDLFYLAFPNFNFPKDYLVNILIVVWVRAGFKENLIGDAKTLVVEG
jgi:hypothetical protein